MAEVSHEEVILRKVKTLPAGYIAVLAKQLGITIGKTAAETIANIAASQPDEKVLDEYIKQTYQMEVVGRRGVTREDIEKEVTKVSSHVWGMVQGGWDQFVQHNYVRKYPNYDQLISAIDSEVLDKARAYILASWYNHWTTSVIEDIIATQPNVVPTVKKVKDTDIFWLGQPWDIKNTNIPKEWFTDGHTLDEAMANPAELGKYLYELQGAERFGDNNRLFLIIADKANPTETWKLKRNFGLIESKVKEFFATTQNYDTVPFTYSGQPHIAHSKILFITQ